MANRDSRWWGPARENKSTAGEIVCLLRQTHIGKSALLVQVFAETHDALAGEDTENRPLVLGKF